MTTAQENADIARYADLAKDQGYIDPLRLQNTTAHKRTSKLRVLWTLRTQRQRLWINHNILWHLRKPHA